jgi:hypothetical protein
VSHSAPRYSGFAAQHVDADQWHYLSHSLGPRLKVAPTDAELGWADRIIAAVEGSSDDVLLVDGAMVDKPVVDRARRILGAAATRGA